MTWDRVAIVERQLDSYLDSAQAAAARLAARPAAGRRRADGRHRPRAVRGPGRLSPVDVAARELKKTNRSFYTIGSRRPREQRGHRRPPAHRRSRLPALSVRRLHAGARRASCPAARRSWTRCWRGRLERGPDQPGPPQGVGQPARCGCRRRPARSPATCRRRWASRSASPAPSASASATDLPGDAIVVCSFGDASANHATALSAFNAARYAVRLGLPMPLLFVCEDNGIGISVPTPEGWIASTFGNQPHLEYFAADGELDDVWEAVGRAIEHVRAAPAAGVPAPAHGAALGPCRQRRGAGVPNACRDRGGRSARPAAPQRAAAGRDRRRDAGRAARSRARDARPGAGRRRGGRAPAAAADDRGSRRPAGAVPPRAGRTAVGRSRCSRDERIALVRRRRSRRTPRAHRPHPRRLLNAALADELLRRPELLVFGEDVGRKGGVYNVTNGLQRRFGSGRVFDTLLDETSILGIAQGAAHIGLLPVPEIQYLAYVHNALDQIRGEAASLQFFSSGQFRNPMVVRIPGLGYQKGFGGHFHNDNTSARCATSRAWCSQSRPAATTRPACCAARRHGRRGRARRHLPRADRALPREGPPRRGRRRLAVRLSAAAGDAPAGRGRASTARRYGTPTSSSSATPTACA